MRLLYIIFFILFAAVALAQNKEQTLADVRQDLTILYIEMLKTKERAIHNWRCVTPSYYQWLEFS